MEPPPRFLRFARGADYSPPDACPSLRQAVRLIVAGVAVVVVAQIIGVYALISHRADLVFSSVVIALLVIAAILAGYGFYAGLG